ncbi:ATP synthase subunit delta [subsurface metagenome]
MARRIYARRYSQAVFNIALERKELDRWQSDLKKMATVGQDAAFIALMENPKVGFEKKAKILSKLLGDINPLALNLVYLLTTRGSSSMVGDIAEEYQRLLDSYRGIEQAEVITAVPLDAQERQKLEEHLGKVVGKKVTLTASVDPSLVGGMIARVGGKLLDGSTISRLMALKKELAGGGVK